MLTVEVRFEMTRTGLEGIELYGQLMHAFRPQLAWISEAYEYAGDTPIKKVHKQCLRHLKTWLRRTHEQAGRPRWKFWAVRGKLTMVKVTNQHGRCIAWLDVEENVWYNGEPTVEGDDDWED